MSSLGQSLQKFPCLFVTHIAKLVYVDPMTLQYLLSLRRQIDSDLTLVISNNLI